MRLTPEQTRRLLEQITPMHDYLCRLKRRIQQIGVLEDPRLEAMVNGAHWAMDALIVELKYRIYGAEMWKADDPPK